MCIGPGATQELGVVSESTAEFKRCPQEPEMTTVSHPPFAAFNPRRQWGRRRFAHHRRARAGSQIWTRCVAEQAAPDTQTHTRIKSDLRRLCTSCRNRRNYCTCVERLCVCVSHRRLQEEKSPPLQVSLQASQSSPPFTDSSARLAQEPWPPDSTQQAIARPIKLGKGESELPAEATSPRPR